MEIEDALDELGRRDRVDPADELGDVLAGEPPERHSLREPPRQNRFEKTPEVRVVVDLGVTVSPHDEHGHRLHLRREMLHQGEGRRVPAMKVLEEKDERSEPSHETDDAFEQIKLPRLGWKPGGWWKVLDLRANLRDERGELGTRRAENLSQSRRLETSRGALDRLDDGDEGRGRVGLVAAPEGCL